MTSIRFTLALLAATVVATPAPRAPSPPIPLPGPTGWAPAVYNPYFTLRPGTVFVYTTREGAQAGTDTVTVTRETKLILGVRAVVVRDRAYRHGVLVEDTYDWYAQDTAGNVWYLGEDTREYRSGKVVSTAGSWQAGRKGAQPGIVMWGKPRPGPAYRQEFLPGVAEDMARVLDAAASVTIPGTTYDGCVKTEEWSPLEPHVKEHKFYARGIGLVREVTVQGGNEEMVLVKVISP